MQLNGLTMDGSRAKCKRASGSVRFGGSRGFGASFFRPQAFLRVSQANDDCEQSIGGLLDVENSGVGPFALLTCRFARSGNLEENQLDVTTVKLFNLKSKRTFLFSKCLMQPANEQSTTPTERSSVWSTDRWDQSKVFDQKTYKQHSRATRSWTSDSSTINATC